MPSPLVTRGVRGATTVLADEPGLVLAATGELLGRLLADNGILPEDIGAIFFTTTHDLRSAFPAEAARALGLTQVPLMCTQEIPVPGSLPRAIRVMLLWNTAVPQDAIKHVYLRDAVKLRPDLVGGGKREAMAMRVSTEVE
jgi:chorismate mutase